MKITDYQPQPNAEKISDDREYVAALSAEIAEHEKALSFIEAPNG